MPLLGCFCWDRAVGSSSTMKPMGFVVVSLLLQSESRGSVEGQVWTSQSSKARQGGQPSATRRESWGYEGHYRKAGGQRKGVKEIKAMKLQTEIHEAALGQGHFLYFSLSRMGWAENALKAKTRPKRGGIMHWSALQLSKKWYKKAQKGEQLILFDQIKISGKSDKAEGNAFPKPPFWV